MVVASKKSRKKLYEPGQDKPFKISRSKIELYCECPRCFYLDRRLGISRPPGFPFNLNSAVDALLKNEFDLHREAGTPHPLMVEHGVDAVPFYHEDLNLWRHNFSGVKFVHEATGLHVFGAVDDLWVNADGELHVVDYKATSKSSPITLDADWQNSYKRQMEIYQWLLRRNGFKVSSKGFFVYCNGRRDADRFDARLNFDILLIPYIGNDSWVEPTIMRLFDCLNSDEAPEASLGCKYCDYCENAMHALYRNTESSSFECERI